MSEGGGWCWVSKVVGWHVHRLHRGNRTLLRGGDALLEFTHLLCECWLVSHRAWHALPALHSSVRTRAPSYQAHLTRPFRDTDHFPHARALPLPQILNIRRD